MYTSSQRFFLFFCCLRRKKKWRQLASSNHVFVSEIAKKPSEAKSKTVLISVIIPTDFASQLAILEA